MYTRTSRDSRLKVTVVGAGYVGIVTSACLAFLGHEVACVDTDEARVASLRAGAMPIHEPDLHELVAQVVAAGRLRFSSNLEESTRGSDIAFVAVGTLDGTGNWTDRHVRAVLEALLEQEIVPRRIVVRSTLRPGRMSQLAALVEASGRSTELLLNPEFTREGSAISDFLRPDRIVVGIRPGAPDSVVDCIREVYAEVSAPFLVVDHASAELIKIGSNAFLATKVMFANEMARFARFLGADMADVREGMGLDPRIGEQFLKPGPGVGGSCLPSQLALLTLMATELGVDAELIRAVEVGTFRQPERIIDELLASGSIKHVAMLGLAFKAGTDDLRASPAIRLAELLQARNVRVSAHDPAVPTAPAHYGIAVVGDPYMAAVGADALVIATEWPQYGQLDWNVLGSLMTGRIVYDTRAVIDADCAIAAGFTVLSLERSTRRPSLNLTATNVRAEWHASYRRPERRNVETAEPVAAGVG